MLPRRLCLKIGKNGGLTNGGFQRILHYNNQTL